MMKKYRRLWGNSVNLSGLYSNEPVELHFDWKVKDWWDKEGNFGQVREYGLGLYQQDGYIQFTSPSYKEVKRWTEGVKAAMKLLRAWST